MPNTENINKLIKALKDDRGRARSHFVMSDFALPLGRPKDEHGYQDCKTAMCLCGWANVLRLQEAESQDLHSGIFWSRARDQEAAAEWLGIEDAIGKSLFNMWSVETVGDPLHDFDRWPDEEAQHSTGIYVLEHLRDTGKENWPLALEKAGINLSEDEDDEYY